MKRQLLQGDMGKEAVEMLKGGVPSETNLVLLISGCDLFLNLFLLLN